ncbi:hypothetical protein Cenrod_2660 [Candidatus Symbiobacter mobilis CR]|uniref:Uncharacterized protein n=1 Tax=Candidatus Symbiobacter mobilis CR TaxID=946483 RepID=U5NBL9_9BURK|nr:hypothetical protein Cenrod_2660 [Candidatus Symbiobacter mobilis CR]
MVKIQGWAIDKDRASVRGTVAQEPQCTGGIGGFRGPLSRNLFQ